MQGAGSVTGRVVSSPAGIDCEVVSNGGGTNDKQCEATLPAGPVTLQFTPTGAAYTAQFSLAGAGQHQQLCHSTDEGRTCAGEAYTLTLDRDQQIGVFPISVPPPPGP